MCKSKILLVSYPVFCNLETCQHFENFENVNRNTLLKSWVNQKIPPTTKTLISLEKFLTKSFYLTLVLISLFYSYISLALSTTKMVSQFFLPEKPIHEIEISTPGNSVSFLKY